MCTDVKLMSEKQERGRERKEVAAKTEPENGNDRPTDCRLRGQDFFAAVGRVYYFRMQLVTITS